MFLLEDEFTIGGFELGWFLFDAPVNLSIACFCLSRSAGENYLFFKSALDDFTEPQSFYLLLGRAGLLRVPALLLIKWEETTGLTGGLYSVFLGIEGVLIFGVVLSN